jgi:hypothetical protein
MKLEFKYKLTLKSVLKKINIFFNLIQIVYDVINTYSNHKKIECNKNYYKT